MIPMMTMIQKLKDINYLFMFSFFNYSSNSLSFSSDNYSDSLSPYNYELFYNCMFGLINERF